MRELMTSMRTRFGGKSQIAAWTGKGAHRPRASRLEPVLAAGPTQHFKWGRRPLRGLCQCYVHVSDVRFVHAERLEDLDLRVWAAGDGAAMVANGLAKEVPLARMNPSSLRVDRDDPLYVPGQIVAVELDLDMRQPVTANPVSQGFWQSVSEPP